MPHELKGREILKVGKFNGVDISLNDLEDIVSNFDKLKDSHKVPLKFGHDADHEDGQPAIGWVSRLFQKGEKLFADFSDMPTIVLEAIKNKLYRTVSVELLFNVNSDGKKFNHVLDAVALLGADKPAVSGLADLDALLATRTRFTGGHRVAFSTIAGKRQGNNQPIRYRIIDQDGNDVLLPENHFVLLNDKEDDELDKKEVQDLIDATTAPLKEANTQLTKDLKAANEKLAKFTQDKADDEKTVLEAKVKLARKTVTDVLDTAVHAKTMTPAIRETYEKQIGLSDDERVLKINVADIKTMFSIKDTDGQQGRHKDTEDNSDESAETKIMALTRKNQADTGEKNFAVAFSLVCAANPKLHVEYLNANDGGE